MVRLGECQSETGFSINAILYSQVPIPAMVCHPYQHAIKVVAGLETGLVPSAARGSASIKGSSLSTDRMDGQLDRRTEEEGQTELGVKEEYLYWPEVVEGGFRCRHLRRKMM